MICIMTKRRLCVPQIFGEGGSSRCVAVQMHNLQHKFLHWTLQRQQIGQHVSPSPNVVTRASLVRAALFYLHRKAADRRDKIGRLLELALGDLQDSEAIKELSQVLSESGVDLDTHALNTGESSP